MQLLPPLSLNRISLCREHMVPGAHDLWRRPTSRTFWAHRILETGTSGGSILSCLDPHCHTQPDIITTPPPCPHAGPFSPWSWVGITFMENQMWFKKLHLPTHIEDSVTVDLKLWSWSLRCLSRPTGHLAHLSPPPSCLTRQTLPLGPTQQSTFKNHVIVFLLFAKVVHVNGRIFVQQTVKDTWKPNFPGDPTPRDKHGYHFVGLLFSLPKFDFKNSTRASLVAQWLRIHLPMQGHGFEPWSRKIPHAAEQLSPCATTTEPAL